MTADKAGTEYPCDSKLCGEEYFKFPIGVSSVNFTATDRAGNSASCIFTVTVKGKLGMLACFSFTASLFYYLPLLCIFALAPMDG